MSGRVVNRRAGEPYDVYIGRPIPRIGLTGSDWQNPYKRPKNASREEREEAIAKYERYLLKERQDLVERRPELRGKVLGC
jgi:hypothetical protein